ncbi:pyridoxamine 5'-phosphate oxidase [Aphanothece hegewaldii CCALA 016]|uniref:Pyridoxamine 5'-phosphate oxidase n=1 Tax=Aphanothece hegewaldii CCALA 016 TaxID=2107694 RepID=A0A2T1M3M8_9CHRO|nr:pyridoxamine 5'-phosphate oxidase family protein [Aphanothece hegewaldii]PSF39447.1 pyridoxamine 5'-phosphate oxidase [Aphanothece hegewaldii CCALA 016]
MSKFYSYLTPTLENFIQKQKIFFTATAPKEGRINLSPKGMDTFRCIDTQTVAYLDLTGSGNETAAHLAENDRITLMFCSFSEEPLILRLYGKGQSIRPRHHDWESLATLFPSMAGTRQIILMKIDSIQTSCGYGVPLYDFQQERKKLVNWAEQKGEKAIQDYWELKNQKSIDGLPTYLLKEKNEEIY